MDGQPSTPERRKFFSLLFAGAGLAASYGTLLYYAARFILPKLEKPKTRRLFAGKSEQYEIGGVQSFHDLQGNEILIKRDTGGFRAFNVTCPHLGCKVHWQKEQKQFFCPCHNGAFDADGNGVSGPPVGMTLKQVSVDVDEKSGVVYLEVRHDSAK